MEMQWLLFLQNILGKWLDCVQKTSFNVYAMSTYLCTYLWSNTYVLMWFRWFCEGKELENSPDIQIIANGEQHSLIIAEAFEEDTGRYSCFASNFYGTDSTSAEIYIEGQVTPAL